MIDSTITKEEKTYKKRIDYLRVSTDDQSIDRQRDGLQVHCDELHIEQGVSAAAKTRPVFEKVLSEIGEGDTLLFGI